MRQTTGAKVQFNVETGAKVPFIVENVTRCMCPGCPVQSASQCVSGKMLGIEDVLKSNPLKREDVPGDYCSTGTATCQDIDISQACSCFDCPVYSEYQLASGQPTCYFCKDGNAR